ncbi:hypothetical protein FE251_11900 [Georgenia wutianyii]|uniref:DUF6318 domain-containing protein n=1 Tax=Georgenia wutianyii TaxID=2585135 RepID=A0ABX5VNB7_9MICO|nr:DUF6318 family protein [Georgenia wutianyii]QDB80004.1 hypothetical protein FE251_11900 [Georgenia wutianyii]
MTRALMTRRMAAAVLATGLLLAGCSSGDGQPEPTGSATDVSSESPSSTEPTTAAPGPTPWPEPTRPTAMERDDIEGAKAAAEYFLALYPYVYATGDLEEWQAMSHPECQFCAAVADDVSELHSSGGYGVGGEIVVAEMGALPPDGEYTHFRVGVRGTESASSSFSADGEPLASAKGGEVNYTIAVLAEDGWTIRGLATEEQ